MTFNISKPIRNSNINDNQKHGTIYPDLRSSPAVGSEKGNANDQNLNKIFGTEESSFFNNKVNSTATVALSYFSGLQGYNKNPANDLIDGTGAVADIVVKLTQEISVIEGDASLTQPEKDTQISYIQAKIDKISLNINDANEEPEVLDAQGNPENEENNFNPDFGLSSIRWRYSTAAENPPINRSSDGINSATKYPNIAFPLTAVASDTGIVNLEANSSAPSIVPVTNNYQSDIDVALRAAPGSKADITKIMSRYVPE